jgi:four helix bundle protein
MPLSLTDLEIYRRAEHIADEIWEIVSRWEYFPKHTVGRQLVEAADSISANISEGFGRYYFKENIRFCYYARGSLTETLHWLRRARNRALSDETTVQTIEEELDVLGKKLNAYISSLKKIDGKKE